jgi:uncharacterized surface protein with fasciclin (FAS1) repeats
MAANLVQAVDTLTDATIFAPSNAAFQAIGGGLASLAMSDVVNVLGYHVLANDLRFSTDLLGANQLSFLTVAGQNLTVRKENGELFVNSAKILIPDILTSNGVVHVIDK